MKLKSLLLLTALTVCTTTSFAENEDFTCPQPNEIQSTNFSTPSIWVGPPMPHALPEKVGVGLGGERPTKLLGVKEYDNVGGSPGWICMYSSEGGVAYNAYRSKLIDVAKSNRYLEKYVEKITKEFENGAPYLEGYPQDQDLGFVGYQKATTYPTSSSKATPAHKQKKKLAQHPAKHKKPTS